MADISKITLPSGTTYDIKDQGARDLIDALESYSSYLGVTTTALTDGATTNPITIGGQSVTAKNGSVVNYGSKEFIFNGTAWQEFGDLSALGALAYKDSASGSFTPVGTVSQPTFTGSSSNVTITASDNASGNYQPKGTVSKPTFEGSPSSVTITSADNANGNYQPKGTVSQPSFTGTTQYLKANASYESLDYTPQGSVSAPTISVDTAGSTTTIKNPTKVTVAKTVVAQAPSSSSHPANNITYYSVANETLSLYQLGYTTGDSITTTDVTVKNGDASYSASTPSFTGTTQPMTLITDVYLSTANAPEDRAVDITPNGSVSQPTFTGTKAQLSGTTTAEGEVSQPTFTGTKAQLSGTTTANGTVSQPSFSGTAGTVQVS